MERGMERGMVGNLQYIVKKPGKVMEKNPTIIYLHGAGARGTDVRILESCSLLGQDSHISDEDSPFVVFMPQCSRNSWFDMFEQLQEFVKMVAAHPIVDSSRLYLVGASMGGYGAWQLAMSIPEYFAALVPICGGGMCWNTKRLIHIPVWAFHGKEDKTVPPEQSIFMVDKLINVGGDARLTLLDNTEHNSWDYAFSQRELFDWLLEHTKADTSVVQDSEWADIKRFG
jgi:predicted peptidase